MRFARALLASIGASTCLVLAGTLTMAALSAVVAFSGLPGLNAPPAAPPAAILAVAEPAAAPDEDGRAPAPMTLPPVRDVRASAPSRPVSRPDRLRAEGPATPTAAPAPDPDGSRARRPTAPAPSPSSRVPRPVAPGPAVPALPAGDAVREAASALTGAATNTTNGLAKAIEPGAPGAATVLTGTGGIAAGTVDAAAAAVAGLLDGLAGG